MKTLRNARIIRKYTIIIEKIGALVEEEVLSIDEQETLRMIHESLRTLRSEREVR